MQTIFSHLDSIRRTGNEANLGVLRRHSRNGNKPVVIFQGKDDTGADIVTINWQDGTYCILPETLAVWHTLLTIKAFVGCEVAHGSRTVWHCTQEWVAYASVFFGNHKREPKAEDCEGCGGNLTDADRASLLGVCKACCEEYHADTLSWDSVEA